MYMKIDGQIHLWRVGFLKIKQKQLSHLIEWYILNNTETNNCVVEWYILNTRETNNYVVKRHILKNEKNEPLSHLIERFILNV